MTKPIPKPYAGATLDEAGKWLTVAGALCAELLPSMA